MTFERDSAAVLEFAKELNSPTTHAAAYKRLFSNQGINLPNPESVVAAVGTLSRPNAFAIIDKILKDQSVSLHYKARAVLAEIMLLRSRSPKADVEAALANLAAIVEAAQGGDEINTSFRQAFQLLLEKRPKAYVELVKIYAAGCKYGHLNRPEPVIDQILLNRGDAQLVYEIHKQRMANDSNEAFQWGGYFIKNGDHDLAARCYWTGIKALIPGHSIPITHLLEQDRRNQHPAYALLFGQIALNASDQRFETVLDELLGVAGWNDRSKAKYATEVKSALEAVRRGDWGSTEPLVQRIVAAGLERFGAMKGAIREKGLRLPTPTLVGEPTG